MKADQERVKTLLTDTVTLLCKNGLFFSRHLKVQGLLGITIDDNEVFIVHINEVFEDGATTLESVLQTTDSKNNITESFGSSSPSFQSHSNILSPATGPSLKRKRRDWSPVPVPSPVASNKDDSNEQVIESRCKQFVYDVQEERSCPETIVDSTDKPKQEKSKCFREQNIENDVIVKEEKDEDCAVLDDTIISEQKVFSNSTELLQLFNQFEPNGEEDLDGLLTDSFSSRMQTTSDSVASSMMSKLHQLTNAKTSNTSIVDSLNIWNPSLSRQRLVTDGLNAGENLFDAKGNGQFDNQDIYVLPKLLLTGRRTMAAVRRKRYECTLDSCGRQYQNTFDLYRHQRQKHNVPPEFYQQGKKQTIGIREIDPS